jgi:hypothetical protein
MKISPRHRSDGQVWYSMTWQDLDGRWSAKTAYQVKGFSFFTELVTWRFLKAPRLKGKMKPWLIFLKEKKNYIIFYIDKKKIIIIIIIILKCCLF